MEKQDRGEENARAWAQSIIEMVAALNCDYDRLEELRDERDSIVADFNAAEGDVEADVHVKALAKWDEEHGDELKELTEAAGEFKSADEARECISESPLSVQVRSGWTYPGFDMEPEDFEILLTTGGPALRIMGELDEHRQPCRAWLEYQDWGTPWTEIFGVIQRGTLLEFCQHFYFGG